MSEQIIQRAAALRGQGNFQEAIQLIESNLGEFNEITKLPALLQGFYAAQEGSDTSKAKSFAKLIQAIDPNVPSIQSYLA